MAANAEVLNDDRVVLLDKTLNASNNIIEENRRLRDEMKARDEENSKRLQDVLDELRQLKENQQGDQQRVQRQQTRKRKQKVQVPPICRRTLRKVFQTLADKDDFPGFVLGESVNSVSNSETLRRIKDEIYHYVGGQERCAWSDAQIEEAFRRYFLSSFEREKKKDAGTYDQHKRKCRQQARKREKLSRRTLALESVRKWDTKVKGKVAEVLTEEFMSCEESEEEEGSPVYVIKTLAWESELLKKRKKKLDKAYAKKQSKRSKQRAVKRVRREGDFSPLQKPENCPKWACVSEAASRGE